jgi:hypothetical protein
MRVICLIFLAWLSGCAVQPVSREQVSDTRLHQMIERVAQGDTQVSYSEFWKTFLDSSQVNNSISESDWLHKNLEDIENGLKSCDQVDWNSVFDQYVYALKSHMSAIGCYQESGNTAAQQRHERVMNFIVQGILSNNSGRYNFDAYKVPTWGDAEELLDIAGYRIIDDYFDFKNNRSFIYRVFVVEDPETGRSSLIYFNINEFIHSVIGIQFPFAGIQDAMYNNVILALEETDHAAKLAKADIVAYQQEYQNAEQAYLDAIALGSVRANYRLAELCLKGHTTRFAKDECAQLLVAAASDDYHLAKVLLAYMMYEGIGIEQDLQLADELIQNAADKLEPGEAYWRLSRLYSSESYAEKNQEKAAYYLNQAADAGNLEAGLALLLKDFVALSENYSDERHAQLLKQTQAMAEKGHPIAQYMLADVFDEELSAEQRLHWYQQAAAAHLPGAQYDLARVYYWGLLEQQKNPSLARSLYQQAAENGHLKAQFRMGWFEMDGTFAEKNYSRALLWYFLCARSGDNDCMTNLAYMYERGYGVEQDAEQALYFYGLAAKDDFPRALYNIAEMYYEGKVVPKDRAKALSYYRRAASQKHPASQNVIGLYYLEGDGVEVNYAEARKWFEQSAEQDNEYAFWNLGRMSENGWGVEKDPAAAIEYYKQAADRGHPEAMIKVAGAYETGELLEQNIQLAIEYYLKALAAGNDSAGAKLKQLCSRVGTQAAGSCSF